MSRGVFWFLKLSLTSLSLIPRKESKSTGGMKSIWKYLSLLKSAWALLELGIALSQSHCGKCFLFWLHVEKALGSECKHYPCSIWASYCLLFFLTVAYRIYSSNTTPTPCPVSVPTDFIVTSTNRGEIEEGLAFLVCCCLVELVQDFALLKQKPAEVRATCSGKSLWDAIKF